ncbi:MAG TPA: hypothetical protein VNG90_00045, partial [Candidatus Acidoferrum sp.]|nr:hypothetical protein [Candidatus Acidoferrum sp.]
MIDRIKRHNGINGFLFSFIEFGLVALLVGGFAIYAFAQGKTLMGIAGLGIAANCLPVMLYSFRSFMAGEKAIGLRAWLNRSGRLLIAKRYPET